MPAYSNTVVLSGNITRDPELKYMNSGAALARFGLAVNRGKRLPNGEWEDESHFFDIVVWDDLAQNVADCLKKGDRIILEGRLNYHTWEDAETGMTKSRVEVYAHDIGASLRWATVEIEKTRGVSSGANSRNVDDEGAQGRRRQPSNRRFSPPEDSYYDEPF